MSGRGALRIATRGSELAMVQTRWVAGILASEAGQEVEIVTVRTTGDRITDVPLARIGDRGLFTKELDEALRSDRADFAIHSMKDVPTTFPDDLELVPVGRREDPRDALVLAPGIACGGIAALPEGARVGTSALRRRSQLAAVRTDLRVEDIRGNIDTRLRKLDDGEYDALILAAAGLVRSGRRDRITSPLARADWTPAVGQGALAAVCRRGDQGVRRTLAALEDPSTVAAVLAERAFLRMLEGGCQVPIGGHARIEGDQVVVRGFVGALDGSVVIRGEESGAAEHPEAAGIALARQLLRQGAAEVLDEVRRTFEESGGRVQ